MRSHSVVELKCWIKYLKYLAIVLILCWRRSHPATIEFQLLNLAIRINICKALKVVWCAIFWKIFNHVSPIHDSPVLYLISALNLFGSASLLLQDVGYLYNDQARQILVKIRKHIGKEVQQRHQERAILYNSKCEVNKAHWLCLRYGAPKPIVDFWIFCFD